MSYVIYCVNHNVPNKMLKGKDILCDRITGECFKKFQPT